jgi:hypothetical protein
MSDRACKNCIWYNETQFSHGQCRVNPPGGPFYYRDPDTDTAMVDKWPHVDANEWCGQMIKRRDSQSRV